jgi:hypothetical protein
MRQRCLVDFVQPARTRRMTAAQQQIATCTPLKLSGTWDRAMQAFFMKAAAIRRKMGYV